MSDQKRDFVKDFRAYARAPIKASEFVPIHQSTLGAVADELERYRNVVRDLLQNHDDCLCRESLRMLREVDADALPHCFFCGKPLYEHESNAQGHPWRRGSRVTAADLNHADDTTRRLYSHG